MLIEITLAVAVLSVLCSFLVGIIIGLCYNRSNPQPNRW